MTGAFWMKCILFSLALLHSTFVSSSSVSSRPHIILIVADDLGYNDVSFHGSEQIPTPNLDFLAYSGIILNNYYVSPICTPTRSALLTGRHPIHTGMQHDVIKGDEPFGLPLSEVLLPQYLRQIGYRTHIVGKWHLGMFQWSYTPLYRGFESHFGYFQGREDYYNHTYEAAQMHAMGLDFRRNKEAVWNYTDQYSTTLFRDEAVKIIISHNKSEIMLTKSIQYCFSDSFITSHQQPLFLYLPFQAVHSGNADGPHLQAPKKYIDKFPYIQNEQRRIYAGMVSALDDAVGDVYGTLKASGLLSNSIIVFTTDNGGPANGYDHNAANNFPLRGSKATLWEGGVRGVGFVHSPLLMTQGYVSNQMLHVCDWLPTLYRAAGGDPSSMKHLDGFDAWEMLNENGKPVRSEILHNIDPIPPHAAIRVGDFKLLVGKIGKKMRGWYPPYQLSDDNIFLHISNYTDSFQESELKTKLRLDQQSKFKSSWSADVHDRIRVLQTSSEHLQKAQNLTDSSQEYRKLFTMYSTISKSSAANEGSRFLGKNPVAVKCGPKPANASKNCHPSKSPCLFNIREDPCEYHNIAESLPDMVKHLLARLESYNETAVPPRNQPPDNRGNPVYHGGVWTPWE